MGDGKGTEDEKEGVGIHPTRGHLQLFIRGSAYGVAMVRVHGVVALMQSSGDRCKLDRTLSLCTQFT